MSNDLTSSNKTTFTHFHEAMSSDDAELRSKAIDDLVEPDAVVRTPFPLETTGAQALKELFEMLHRVYADLRVTVKELIAEGDKVVGVNSVTGTHQGEYMGVAPTGKSVTYDEIFVFRFVNGRIAESSGVVDVFAQAKQIGLIPGGAA
jgi:predicted ester cyclase